MADSKETSRLLDVSLPFYKTNIARNRYDTNDQFNAAHSDAISNGDELGKEENNGQIGGTTDIKERKKEVTKNPYNANRMYDASTA